MGELEMAAGNSWGLSADNYLEKEKPICDGKYRKFLSQKGIRADDNTYATVVTLVAGGYLEEAASVLKYKCNASLDLSGQVVSRIYSELKPGMLKIYKVTGISVGMVVPAIAIVATCIWAALL